MENLFSLLQSCSLFKNKSLDEIRTLLDKLSFPVVCVWLFKKYEWSIEKILTHLL